MNIERELFDLCEKFVELLLELKEQSIINDEDYKIYSNEKNKFIEYYIKKDNF